MCARPPAPVLEKIDTIPALREALSRRRGVLGLVPTMGALHAGHAALIRRARSECDAVAVSIFINPLQFDNKDDLTRYPRTLDADLDVCRELGVDIVFAPSAREVYPLEPECSVDVGRLADHLCGKFRPGHFRGVATVVLKLFQMVQPQQAYFGEKDAQQLAIIRRMVSDFNIPIGIVGVETVREPDGLALSSRNRHLNVEQRSAAPSLYRALDGARRLIESGDTNVASVCRDAAARIAEAPILRLEYLEIVHPQTLQPIETVQGRALVAGAVWVGATRLIDNVMIGT